MPTASRVHPSAIVSAACEIAPDVEIGPHCVLTGAVTLEAGVRLISHVCIEGPCRIGEGSVLHPGVCVGFPPQDVKWKSGMPTAGVVIGKHTVLREHVTIHAASKSADLGPPTTVGDRCFLMVNSHLGHDGRIGNDVVVVNAVLLAGHTDIGDKATLGGGVAVHQFNRIGRFAFLSGGTVYALDVPPFCIGGKRNTIYGINVVGLRRNGFPREHITALRRAFREAFRVVHPRREQIAVLESLGRDCPPILEMAEFIKGSKRGICRVSTEAHDDHDDHDDQDHQAAKH